MRCFIQFLILMGILSTQIQLAVFAQSVCTGAGQLPVMPKVAGACMEWKDYIGTWPESVPIKRIRVSVHVLCKGDTFLQGTELDQFGNFAPTQANRNFIRNTFEYISAPQTPLTQITGMGDVYANLSPPKLNHGSLYLRDSRIRFVVDSIYFWFLDSLYEGMRSPGDIWQFRASCRYHCVEQNPGNNPDNLQVYLGAFPNSPNYAIPAHTDLIVSSGFYFDRYNPGNLRHEIAHALGLIHTLYDLIGNCKPYQDDGCDDTPRPADVQQNPCCWNGPECSNNLVDNNIDCNALTACQIGMIHAGLMGDRPGFSHKALIPDHCTYQPQNSTVIPTGRQEVWLGPHWLQGDLIISSGAELTVRCTVSLPQGARVIVQPGGKLILDGALLTNVCGDMWGGIEVQGISSLPAGSPAQGQLYLKANAQIEHAITAVKLYATLPTSGLPDHQSTGGALSAEYSVFKNNHVSVSALPNAALKYPCFLKHCKFIISDPLRSNLWGAPDFIHLIGVQHVRIEHNVFDNLVPAYRDKIIAIRGTECSGIWESNQFVFLKTGLYIQQINGTRKLKVRNNYYSDCLNAVYLEGTHGAEVLGNQFFIPVCAQHPCNAYGSRPVCSGLHIKNSTAYTIQKNIFSAMHTLPPLSAGFVPVIGCILEDSGVEANMISMNTFSELNRGIEVRGIHRDIKDPSGYGKGLQILCNAFYRQVDNAIAMDDGYVAAYQGEWDLMRKEWKPAGNVFHHFSGLTQQPAFHHWYDASPLLYPVQYIQSPGVEHQLITGSYDPARIQTGTTLCHPDALECGLSQLEEQELQDWGSATHALKQALETLALAGANMTPYERTAWQTIADKSTQALLASGDVKIMQSLLEISKQADIGFRVWQQSLLLPDGFDLMQKAESQMLATYPEMAPMLEDLKKCHALFSGAEYVETADLNVWPEAYNTLKAQTNHILSAYPGFNDPCVLQGNSQRISESAIIKIENQVMEFLSVYPNPAFSRLCIDGLQAQQLKALRLRITDIYGRVCISHLQPDLQACLDISTLGVGIYLLHIEIPGGNSRVFRFVKQDRE